MRIGHALALLLVAAMLAGCGQQPRPEPPGFASLPPVPKERRHGSFAEFQRRIEVMREVYASLGPEAHWALKEEGRVVFRLADLPEKSREALRAFLQSEDLRSWVEAKVGRPPALDHLTFRLEGKPGATVAMFIEDPADSRSGGLSVGDIGGWPG
jgi:hypothetical protein